MLGSGPYCVVTGDLSAAAAGSAAVDALVAGAVADHDRAAVGAGRRVRGVEHHRRLARRQPIRPILRLHPLRDDLQSIQQPIRHRLFLRRDSLPTNRNARRGAAAVLAHVDEFGRTLLKPLGAPAGKIEAFVETPFKLDNGKSIRPWWEQALI